MGDVIDFILLVILVLFIVRFVMWRVKTHKTPKDLSKKQIKKPEIDSNSRWLAQLGPSHTQRAQAIETTFETRTATQTSTYVADLGWFDKKEPVEAYVMFEASRNLAGMGNRESTYLKFAELLNSAADGKDAALRKWRTALLWGDGKGTFAPHPRQRGLCSEQGAPIAAAVSRRNMTVDQTANAMQRYAASLLGLPDADPTLRAVAEELNDSIASSRGGSCLKSSRIASSPYAQKKRLHAAHRLPAGRDPADLFRRRLDRHDRTTGLRQDPV